MFKTYCWVGGSIEVTFAERFDWNTPGNWKLMEKNTVDDSYTFTDTTDIPSYADIAVIGGLGSVVEVTSPLLFGGFSGDVSNGGWTAGSYGATGTTYTSLLTGLFISGTPLNRVNTTTQTPVIRTDEYEFSYPFSVVGGGFSPENIKQLKTMVIPGMESENWDYLYSNTSANSREKQGLKLKVGKVKINIDSDSNKCPVARNNTWSYKLYKDVYPSLNYDFGDGLGASIDEYIKNERHVQLTLVNHYSPPTFSNESSVEVNSINVKTTLNNSYLSSVGINQPTSPLPTSDPNSIFYPTNKNNPANKQKNCLTLKNTVCETVKISNGTICNISVDDKCTIGSLSHIFTEYSGPKAHLLHRFIIGGSTFDYHAVRRILNNNTRTLYGVTSDNIVIDWTGWTGPKCSISFANPTWSNNNGNYGNTLTCAGNIKIYGTKDPKKWPYTVDYWGIGSSVFIILPAKINTMILDHCELGADTASSLYYDPFTVKITNLLLKNMSRFKVTTDEIKWELGEITNNNYYGGLQLDDPVLDPATGNILGGSYIEVKHGEFNDPVTPMQFITYTVDGYENTRNNTQYTTPEEISSLRAFNRDD